MNTTLNFVPVPSTVNPDWPGIWQKILADEKLFKKMLHPRKRVGRGTFGAVYEIHGAAVKIGCVLPEEAEIQQWVHETYQRALPVWAYVEEMSLPRAITREVCRSPKLVSIQHPSWRGSRVCSGVDLPAG